MDQLLVIFNRKFISNFKNSDGFSQFFQGYCYVVILELHVKLAGGNAHITKY